MQTEGKNGGGLGMRLSLPRPNPALYCLFTHGKNPPGDKTNITNTNDERMPGWLSKNARLDFEIKQDIHGRQGFSN